VGFESSGRDPERTVTVAVLRNDPLKDHDEVLCRTREIVDEVHRIQSERERILSDRIQKQNVAIQRWLMIWVAVIAVSTIVLCFRHW
jgi:hypothetical protein